MVPARVEAPEVMKMILGAGERRGSGMRECVRTLRAR